jgi:hypothetical protein
MTERRRCGQCEKKLPVEWSKQRPYCERCSKQRDAFGPYVNQLDKYGLTVTQYNNILDNQHGCCAICGTHNADERLVIDHDHKTGYVRGLLCNSCNAGLGFFRDSQWRLNMAANYLAQAG